MIVPRRRWALIQTIEGAVHVVPALNGQATHPATSDCPCWPVAVREGPLDEPVWSHQEPGWPGEKIRRRIH